MEKHKLSKKQRTTISRNLPKIRSMFTTRGYIAPNQYITQTKEGTIFQSYSTIIAFKSNKYGILLDRDRWNYSNTTSKYRNQFLQENTADTYEKIKTGEYQLIDLN